MSELPPDGSIVAIKSYQYGTYVTACPDYKSVALQKVENPNKLPKECLWTIRRKHLFLDYIKPTEFLYLISCYGRYLAVDGFVWRELCQVELVTSFSRFMKGTWMYEHIGTTHDKVTYGRIVHSRNGDHLCAQNYGNKVDLQGWQLWLLSKPEAYWTIHCVGNTAPARPRAMCPRSMEDEDEDEDGSHKHRSGRGITIINNNHGVPFYNNSTVIDSGKNMNLDGNQRNEGVIAGNKYYAFKREAFRLKDQTASFDGTETQS